MDISAFVSKFSNNSTRLPSAVLVPLPIPLAQPCVLVFTTMLAELVNPAWPVLLLASTWLSFSALDLVNFVFFITVTPQ